MKEFDELAKQLRATRKAIKQVNARKAMATVFDPQLDLIETIRLMQTEACATASEAQQLCNDLTDLLIELAPIP